MQFSVCHANGAKFVIVVVAAGVASLCRGFCGNCAGCIYVVGPDEQNPKNYKRELDVGDIVDIETDCLGRRSLCLAVRQRWD